LHRKPAWYISGSTASPKKSRSGVYRPRFLGHRIEAYAA